MSASDPTGPGMTPERWHEIETLFVAARERTAEERPAFLNQACGADSALRREVESLLAADDGASGFLDPPDVIRPPPRPDLLGRLTVALAARYTVERELGRGGMATVYLAHDLRHGRPVALKVLHPDLAATLGPERFLREIRTTAALDHPHILPVFESGQAAGLLWYTMPFVEGESLRDRLRREGRLAVEAAVGFTREIADALHHAHERGVVHRDVKPENVLISGDHARVADFGIARALETAGGERLTVSGLVVGTPAYMSPEQGAGSPGDARSDIYSLGCVLYELLAGEPPFTGTTPQAVIARRFVESPPLRRLRKTVPAQISAVLARALARDPADRFQTAADLRDALDGAPVPRTRRIGVAWSGRTAVLVAVATLLTAVVVAAAFHLQRRDSAVSLDERLVAVAPFEVLSPELAIWREGMVDYLSRSLDGAGSLHAVPATTVLRGWQGRADRAAATALGRRTGAALVIYGQLLRSSRDSVRVIASVVDARRGAVIGEAHGAAAGEQVDRAADAAGLEVLRLVGSTQRVGGAGRGRLGSRSPVAVRAFLGGEQYYRRGMVDSAIARYREAIEADSGFTLAHWHLGRVLAWHGLENPVPYFLWAGAHTQGLAPRDSVLITADSIMAALGSSVVMLGQSPVRRLLGSLDALLAQDVRDTEAWFMMGEARLHWGPAVGVSELESLQAFEQAIRLDSLFAPAYIHAVELRMTRGDPAGAFRLYERMQALGSDVPSGTTILGQRHLFRSAANGVAVREDSVTLGDLTFALLNGFRVWPDSGETAVGMARMLLGKIGSEALARSTWDSTVAASALAYRGHAAEALEAAGRNLAVVLQLGVVGAAPADRVEQALRAEQLNELPLEAAAWWNRQKDTLALRRLASLQPADEAVRQNASAYLALMRHDTVAALRALRIITDSLSPDYPVGVMERARLLAASGDAQAAGRQYRRAMTTMGDLWPANVILRLEAGEFAERQGGRDVALDAYRFVAAVWNHADPVFQPYVRRARAGIARLASGS